MKKNVLVFPCGSEIGLEIYRSISYSTHFKVIGASSVDDHGKFVYQNYISGLPNVNSEVFLDKLNDLITAQKVDYIIPAHDSVVLTLARAKASDQLKCELITSSVETCEIARSKRKTYQHLNNVVATPRLFNSIDELTDGDYPVFLKPDVGQGSKGTHLAVSKTDIEFYMQKDPSLLILENLPGKEFTVDCFTDREGQLLFCEARERRRIQNGISVNTTSVSKQEFKDIGEKINETLKLRGAWFFQFKENHNDQPVLMEIAPRIAGAMALVRVKGINLVLMSLFDAMGLQTSIIENNYHIELDKALENKYIHNITYSHVYIDFDDLVVINDKVNPSIMAFVFQCINNGIKIHLLTRHKGDINDRLEKYKLTNVFDDARVIKDTEEKPTYITEKDAIFIDDSFAERKIVYEKCKIPVFDSHMIEALMEKF